MIPETEADKMEAKILEMQERVGEFVDHPEYAALYDMLGTVADRVRCLPVRGGRIDE